jgi:predicted metal-dependent hydrolase
VKRSKTGQLELPLAFRQQQAVGRAHLALEGTLVSYTIKRSLRRRAISILVDDQGVRVGAPWNASHSAIEHLLHKHSAWVVRKLKEWQVRRTAAPRWSDGERVMFLGNPLTLKLIAHDVPVHVAGSELCVASKAEEAPPVSEQVHAWLQQQAITCFSERVAHFSSVLAVGFVPQVFLSSARTRWGSCHSSGRIHLNWRLVQMPLRLLDYVVAHEVAHLVEMNHSTRFWTIVEQLVPDHAARRKELRREAYRYLLV